MKKKLLITIGSLIIGYVLFFVKTRESDANLALNDNKNLISKEMSALKVDSKNHNSEDASKGQETSEEIKSLVCSTLNPNMIFSYITNKMQTRKRATIVENVHFLDDSGGEMRIHIIPDQQDSSSGKYEMQLYRQDKDGYPEKVENLLSKKELLAGRDIIYSHIEESLIFSDDSILNYTKVDDQVIELEFSSGSWTLKCQNTNCICKE